MYQQEKKCPDIRYTAEPEQKAFQLCKGKHFLSVVFQIVFQLCQLHYV